MPPPVGQNWEMFLGEQEKRGPAETDLRTLRAGDRLFVATKNTRYEFEWYEDGSALLRTNRSDRPFGRVKVVGCVFPRSGILAPHVLFHGGKLEYTSMNGEMHHRTTPIQSLAVVRAEGTAEALNAAG